MSEFRYQHGDRPLDGYTIERGIGRGGFGEVYYAVSDSGRQVALKVVQHYEDIELRGISHCMNLKSPHLVTIFDVKSNDSGAPFVVMEYVAGPSLREVLDDSPSGLGTAKAAYFLREMAKGLNHLHDCGIVHRDLKPHNVFYEDGYVKIGDYSLSKAMSTSRHSGHTITVGTVHYMAPEISEGHYDRSIDIYALGAILHEMLTGQPPFVGASPGEVLMKHMTAVPDVADIEEPFASAIKKAMAKDPADRYTSVQDMVEAVFGIDHVRNSVISFSPESLSIVAERAAMHVATGPRSASAHGHFYGGSGRTAGEELSGAINERVNQKVSAAASRIRRKTDDVRKRVMATDDRPLEAPAHPVHDPMAGKQRAHLAMITIAVVSVASALLGPTPTWLTGPIMTFGFTCLAIVGAAEAILKSRKFLVRLESEAIVIQRLALGGLASLAVIVFSAPVLLVNSVLWRMNPWRAFDSSGGGLAGTLIAICIPLFLMNWSSATSPLRRERVSLTHALLAALSGLVGALLFRGDAQIAIAVLAGTALTLQIASLFDPSARKNKSQKVRDPNHGAPEQAEDEPKAAAPPHTGAARRTGRPDASAYPISPSRRLVAMLFSLIPLAGVPLFGIHRFYVGKIGTGILWLFTFGLFGIGQLVDIIMIALGHFTDDQGRRVFVWANASEIKAAASSETARDRQPSLQNASSSSVWAPSPSSTMLSMTGGLLIFIGLALSLLFALDMPGAVQARLLEPALYGADLERVFGYADWPRLVNRIGTLVVIAAMVIAVFPLVAARRGGGILHMVRAVLGVFGLLVGSTGLMSSFRPPWLMVVGQLEANRIGPAIELFLDHIEMTPLVAASLAFLVSFFVLAWPPRRRVVMVNEPPTEEVYQ